MQHHPLERAHGQGVPFRKRTTISRPFLMPATDADQPFRSVSIKFLRKRETCIWDSVAADKANVPARLVAPIERN